MLSVPLLPDSMMRTLTELAALASPKLVGLIRWSELVPRAMGQARSSYAAETRQRAVSGLRAVISEPSLHITDDAHGAATSALALRDLPAEGRKRLGDMALALYFGQLASTHGMFIDFRARGFALDSTGPATIRWAAPAPVWMLDDGFRRQLGGLYRAFYGGDDRAFRDGLQALGLVPARASPAQAESIRQAFIEHFGVGGQQQAVRFSLAQFNASFERILEAAAAAGAKVPGEFAIVGLGLLTLYQTLELLECEHDVRGVFARSALARKDTP